MCGDLAGHGVSRNKSLRLFSRNKRPHPKACVIAMSQSKILNAVKFCIVAGESWPSVHVEPRLYLHWHGWVVGF